MKNNIVKYLDTPIEYLGLSTTITNALKRRNVCSIGDLIDVENEYGLENLRKIGSKSLSSIKEKLLEKCDIKLDELYVDKDITELDIFGFSNRTLNFLVNKFHISTVKELLEIPCGEGNTYPINTLTSTGNEIVSKVHRAGMVFKCEDVLSIEVDDVIVYLEFDKQIESLGLSLFTENALKRSNIYTIRDIIDIENNYGLNSINNIGSKSIKEIKDKLLKRCNINLDGSVNNFDIVKVNYFSLDDLFNTMDINYITSEFYEKVESPKSFVENNFVLLFIRQAQVICRKNDNTNYNNEEIVLFLKRKLLEYKRKMFNISECVVKQLKK